MDGITATIEAKIVRYDPELRYLPNTTPLLKFAVAVFDQKGAQRGEPWEWVDVAVFGELAEQLDGTLRAGDAVRLEGRLRLARWQTVRGEDRATLELSAWAVTPLAAAAPRRKGRAHAAAS